MEECHILYTSIVYTEYLWKITRKSLLQLDGQIRISKVSCNPREIPIETSQKVKFLNTFYKNKLFFVHCRKRKVSVIALCECLLLLEDQAAFHILTSCVQVDADIREDIISLLLLRNDVASAEALVADHITLEGCSIDEMFVQHVLTHYRHHPFNFAPRSPSRRNVRDLVNPSHDKKLGRLRMQAITQTADDGMNVITRGCSQMSTVRKKLTW